LDLYIQKCKERKLTWTKAAPLKAAKIIYIFQLIFCRSGGTPKASAIFHVQFEAVASDTAFARTLAGKISEGYVQDVGPQVVAKVATNKYEQATTPFDADGLSIRTHETSLIVSGFLFVCP
jgi:hypothetical protein